ncbi:hypothetical protein [Agromyces sp. Soil535]|uniref:hypothetical protein n=1 Tax=Agromyces sp. Soil535 TaxID=1736390 RepID=UPI000A6DF5D9|nr:hypothetical protein [Agromyces sp. Soil535]
MTHEARRPTLDHARRTNRGHESALVALIIVVALAAAPSLISIAVIGSILRLLG